MALAVALAAPALHAQEYGTPRVVFVGVVDTTTAGQGAKAERVIDGVLKEAPGIKLVSRRLFARTARREGFRRSEWLSPDALSIVSERIDADYVIIARLSRDSSFSFKAEFLALNRKGKTVSRATTKLALELEGGAEVPSLRAGDFRNTVAELVRDLPPVPRRARKKPRSLKPKKPKKASEPKPAPKPVEDPEPDPGAVSPVGDVSDQAPVDEGSADAPEPDDDTADPDADAVPDDATFEDELFGDADAEMEQTGGFDELGEFDPEGMLSALDRSYTVGGRIFLALTYSSFETLEVPAAFFPISSPSLMDIYADGQPNDRVRAFAQARINYDFTRVIGSSNPLASAGSQVQVQLDQLWLKFDFWRWAFLTAGRQRIRWGVGRFWNPTDFLNRTERDSLDIFDRRLGVDMIKLHVPIEALGINTYAIASLSEAFNPATAGVALRAEWAFWTSEVSASFAYRYNEPMRFGIDGSAGLWLFDFRAEFAALYGVQRDFFRGPFEPQLGLEPEAYKRDEELFVQGVLGAELTIPYYEQDTAVVGVEYFYNGLGYDDPRIYEYLFVRQAFTPLYIGRHYAAGYLAMADPFVLQDTTFLLTNMANLSDLSLLLRADLRMRMLTFLRVNLFATWHYGAIGEFHFAADVPRLPQYPQTTPVSFPPQFVDLGIALAVDL